MKSVRGSSGKSPDGHTLLLLASSVSDLGLGLAGCLLLRHDGGSNRYARQSTRKLDRSM